MSRKRSEPPPNTPTDAELTRALPQNTEAEKMVLGAVILGAPLTEVLLEPGDFSLHSHRQIFGRMKEMADRGEKIDRITIANALMNAGQIESVGGFSYLISLDEGLPAIGNVDAYAKIVADKSRLRQLIFLGQKTIDQAMFQEASVAEIAAYTTEKLLEIQAALGGNLHGQRTPNQVIEQFPGNVSAFLDPTLRARGLPTGFNKLDDLTGGMHGGQFILLAARPSVGKTACAINILQHLTLHPKQRRTAAMFSLEMSAPVLLTRMLCAIARVDSYKFRQGYLNAAERQKLQEALFELTNAHLFINDSGAMSMADISKEIRLMVKEHGIHIAVIDYLGLINPPGRSENRNQEISLITRQAKLLAKELNIPILMLCQLSRQTERRGDPRPILSDLRDSGSIEQDADVVAFIFREEMYKRDREDLRGVAEIIVAKQREGACGIVPLRWIGQFMKFENRSDDEVGS